MDDFLWVLAAAFVVLIAMFFVGFIPGISDSNVADETIEMASFEVGAVGRISEHPASTIELGSFNVGETQTEILKSVPQMRVYTGLGGSESKEYEISITPAFIQLMEGVTLTFDVSETNLYGDLVIKWNGKEFLRGRADPRVYAVAIPSEYVKESNTLEIYAEGPGIIFWAATTYIIKDFEAVLDYGPSKIFSFQLTQDEREAWMKGQISFYAVGTSGKSSSRIITRVNGDEVYSVKPDGAATVEFGYSDAPILLGDNVITFAAQDDVVIVHNAKLTIFLSTTELDKDITFNLDSSEYASIDNQNYRPRLRFFVEHISSGGTLEIGLNGNRRSIQSMTTGANEVWLTKSELQPGTNTIRFSGTGSWYISRAYIELEKIESD